MKTHIKKCFGKPFCNDRIKRSIQAKYNSEINYITSQILANRQIEMDKAPHPEPVDGEELMDDMAQEGTRVVGFVRAQTTETLTVKAALEANPDEIEVEDSSEDEVDGDAAVLPESSGPSGVLEVSKMSIPAAVFGALADKVQEEESVKLGAKDRFKRKRAD